MQDTNRIVLTGRLTRDPELRYTASGLAATTLRLAFTTRRRLDGEWQDKSNYIDVNVLGAAAETAAQYLRKGRQVAVDGRIEWREFEGQDGARRQVIAVNADSVQFLGMPERGEEPPPGAAADPSASPPAASEHDGVPF